MAKHDTRRFSPLFKVCKAFSGASRALARDETGGTAIEYAFIGSGISVVIAGVLFTLGTQLFGNYQAVVDQIVAAAT